jgi:hypothetical protein
MKGRKPRLQDRETPHSADVVDLMAAARESEAKAAASGRPGAAKGRRRARRRSGRTRPKGFGASRLKVLLDRPIRTREHSSCARGDRRSMGIPSGNEAGQPICRWCRDRCSLRAARSAATRAFTNGRFAAVRGTSGSRSRSGQRHVPALRLQCRESASRVDARETPGRRSRREESVARRTAPVEADHIVPWRTAEANADSRITASCVARVMSR